MNHPSIARKILMLAALVLFCGASNVSAVDKEFAPIINHLKTHYKARHRGIPFMGLARFAVKLVRPAGVKSIKMEIFEDLDFSSAHGDAAELSSPRSQLVRSETGGR
ncbi:MAG: hypothetical protein WKF84_28185 [Pyrinomonadaceae bacterium]